MKLFLELLKGKLQGREWILIKTFIGGDVRNTSFFFEIEPPERYVSLDT